MNDAETVLLIDSLENQKSIDIHHASPMMKKIHQRLNALNLSAKNTELFNPVR
jgi:quinol monooxygenase YgiN